MPITKSAKKALRQSLRRKVRNLARKNAYKEAVKEFKRALASGDTAKVNSLAPQVAKTLDKAAKTNAIHWNKASRLKSRLAKLAAKK